MAYESKIRWTDATVNFWLGCKKISPACANCYAERWASRAGRDFDKVVRAKDGTFYLPLHWKDPRVIFTCSLSDFFIEEADQWRDDAWGVIKNMRQHRWLILSKRWQRVRDNKNLIPWFRDNEEPWPHVRFGASAENQFQLEARLPAMFACPAVGYFISAEPLLGPLDLNHVKMFVQPPAYRVKGKPVAPVSCPIEVDALRGRVINSLNLEYPMSRKISTVIVGGESGGPEHRALVFPNMVTKHWEPKALALEWVQSIRYQCQIAHTQFIFKQWGGPRPDSAGHEINGREYLGKVL